MIIFVALINTDRLVWYYWCLRYLAFGHILGMSGRSASSYSLGS